MSTTVSIFTASIGAGHDVPAEVLATALRERGAHAEVIDGLPISGPIMRAVIGGASSGGLDTRAGGIAFEVGYALSTRLTPMRNFGMRAMELVTRKRFAAYFAAHPCDVIVSTYPIWTELFGRMRLAGTLQTPVVAAITDLAALHYWASPGVDLHLITHPESAPEVRRWAGPGTRVEAVHGFTSDPGFADPPPRNAAREALGISTRGSLVVVSGGGWGVGDLQGATDTALHYSAGTVVVLVGSNERARARMEAAYGANERVQIWGFTDKMLLLLAAADVLIHSTAGLTVLEALMCDTRVISYGWPRGHIRVNNRAYEQLGMVAVAKTRPQLAHALVHAITAAPLEARPPDLPAAADLVLGMTEREPAHAG
jgi:hypothetical protein